MAAEGANTSKHIVMCGLGHVGIRVARLLVKLGYCVVAITKEIPVSVAVAADQRLQVIQGDARSVDVVQGAGLDGAAAVMLLTDDDLANVSIALAIRSVNPHVKLILRLFDQRLAENLKKKLGRMSVFSASLIAAPVCVALAMGEDVAAAFEFSDHLYTLEKSGKDTGLQTVMRLRKAVQKSTHSPAEMCWSAFSSLLRIPRPVLLVFGALATISMLGVAVFMTQLQMKAVDAFYFIVTIITTVGFGDYNLQDADWQMKLFGCFLMLSGASLIAALFSIITDGLIRFRFRSFLSNVTSHTKDHVIVVGVGSFGYRVLLALGRQKISAVAIEQEVNCPFLPAARETAAVVIGDGQLEETLARAGIARASALVILTGSDIANLAIALAAQQAWPHCRIVCRLYDSALAEKASGLLGIDSVLSTSSIAAPVFAGSALQDDILCGFETAEALHLFSAGSLASGVPADAVSTTIIPFVVDFGDRCAA